MRISGTRLSLSAAVLIALAGCGKQSAESPITSESPFPFALELAPEAPLSPPRPAADGVFFVMEYASIQHKEGVTGVPPGSVVHYLGQTKDAVLVDFEGTQMELRASQLTNDQNVGEWVMAVDQAKQRNLARMNASQQQSYYKMEKERLARFERSLWEQANSQAGKQNAESSVTNRRMTGESRLHLAPYNPTRGSPVHIHGETDGRKYWADANGGKHYFFYPPDTQNAEPFAPEASSDTSTTPPVPQPAKTSSGPDLNQLNKMIQTYTANLRELGGQN